MPVAAELHVVLLHEDPAGSRSNSAVREGQSRQRLDRPGKRGGHCVGRYRLASSVIRLGGRFDPHNVRLRLPRNAARPAHARPRRTPTRPTHRPALPVLWWDYPSAPARPARMPPSPPEPSAPSLAVPLPLFPPATPGVATARTTVAGQAERGEIAASVPVDKSRICQSTRGSSSSDSHPAAAQERARPSTTSTPGRRRRHLCPSPTRSGI